MPLDDRDDLELVANVMHRLLTDWINGPGLLVLTGRPFLYIGELDRVPITDQEFEVLLKLMHVDTEMPNG